MTNRSNTILPAVGRASEKRYWDNVRLPIGPSGIEVVLVSDGDALTALLIGPLLPADPSTRQGWVHDPTPLSEPASQVQAYADGDLTQFALSLRPSGTAFQQEVWARLL